MLLLTASVSVALYYNITFFGKALVALPSVPVASGCVFYYLCAFNTAPPVAQVVLWMLSFLLSGWIWWAALGESVGTLVLLRRNSDAGWSFLVKRTGLAALACVTALCLVANGISALRSLMG